MVCPCCGKQTIFPVPVNLNQLICPECEAELDAVYWPGAKETVAGSVVKGDGSPPVNHLLMQRLIATCYRAPDFALEV